MKPEQRRLLIEKVVSAHRALDPLERFKPEPAFHDLDEAGRREAYELAAKTRRLEAALDAAGLSSTGWAVLKRITQR